MNHYDLAEVRSLAKAWIYARGQFSDAWEGLDRLIQSQPMAALRTIEEIHHLLTNADVLDMEIWGLLAAGPLEQLLGEHGDVVIERVEQLAKQDSEFRKLLAGVWQHAMDDELYARVQKSSDPTFRFI